MSQATISLQSVDAVKVTVIMDNSLDLLMTGTEFAQRVKLGPHPFERNMPIGEHGFSVLINVKSGDKSGIVLVPGHCTGWQAIHEIARTMPDAFIANSVGTNFVL